MKKKALSLVIAMIMIITSFSFAVPTSAVSAAWDGTTVATGFAGGNGTELNPYRISNGGELAYLAQQVNSGTEANVYSGVYFELTDDIDLGSREWTPIGKSNTANIFCGIFDGAGYSVRNLSVAANTNYFASLFGRMDGTVKNLTVYGKITGYGNSKSGTPSSSVLIGMSNSADARILNCTVYADVDISSCATANMFVAGMAGCFFNGKMENCKVYGTVKASNTASYNVGGIVGYLSNAEMKNCVNYADVEATVASSTLGVGGITHRASGNDGTTCTIINCFNYGNITANAGSGHYRVGGIVGNPGRGPSGKGTMNISGCANFGILTGSTTGATTSSGIGDAAGYDEVGVSSYTNCFGISGATVGRRGSKNTTHTETNCVSGISVDTVTGASVRVDDPTGLRFETEIGKAAWDALAETTGLTVTIGTLITPTAYVAAAGEFTREALDKLKSGGTVDNDTYLNVVFDRGTYSWLRSDDNVYAYTGAVAEIYTQNYNLSYSACGYLRISDATGFSATFYSDYSEADNARKVSFVGNQAYNDRSTAQEGLYVNFIEADGNYSPYTAEQLVKIKVFADAYLPD